MPLKSPNGFSTSNVISLNPAGGLSENAMRKNRALVAGNAMVCSWPPSLGMSTSLRKVWPSSLASTSAIDGAAPNILAAAAPGSLSISVTACMVCGEANSYCTQACWPAGALGNCVVLTRSPSSNRAKLRFPLLEVILGCSAVTGTSLSGAR